LPSSISPSISAYAIVGQAAVARRHGDLARALVDAAEGHYRNVDLLVGQTEVLAGLALAGDQADNAMAFAPEAAEAASASGDPTMHLLADAAMAAAAAIDKPTRPNIDAFVSLARQRTEGLAYPRLTDEPDVAALAARLALPVR
jgi:hypothetical protein